MLKVYKTTHSHPLPFSLSHKQSHIHIIHYKHSKIKTIEAQAYQANTNMGLQKKIGRACVVSKSANKKIGRSCIIQKKIGRSCVVSREA
jgi:hypothetical protein